jgi:hypothetical protein
MFDKYSVDGLLIANSECEAESRLQIDALLITPKAVCIIDFKNFGGKITLPKNAKSEFDYGVWTNEKGEPIKGGSSINPFIQLKTLLFATILFIIILLQECTWADMIRITTDKF